ncbi:MAG: hypothetical protein CMB80_19435 [Flammeovirgaceae bacterium]|nr:hypothetical protein [Flammeovirgaceae bacterium]|tara:strand:- start:4781 stop:5788 length:1008 start_codon:yes stop_codon:yes gene_type:complete
MQQFHFLSDLGKVSLPTKVEIETLEAKNKELVFLILDSSVSLEIANLTKHRKRAKVEKNAIFHLIEYIQKNSVKQTPIFALTELCYDRGTYDILEDKLWDIKNRLDFAFQYPIKRFKRLDFDYDTEYYIFDKPELLSRSISSFTENLNMYYAGLLKIRQIADNGLKKEQAEKNIELFIDWMTTELGVILGLEYSLALEIFGGNSNLRSMIKLGSAKEKSLKGILGTAWDLFHARMSCNRPQLSEMVGQNVYPIFVTKDLGLFELMAPHVEHLIRYDSTKMTITTENNYPPHYSKSFMDYLNEKMLRIGIERVGIERTYDSDKMNKLIKELEENLT